MDYNVNLLQSASQMLGIDINKTSDSFRNEQKIHGTWNETAMDSSMDHWQRRRMGADKKLAQTIAYVQETEKLSDGIDADQRLSALGIYDSKRNIHAALHDVVNAESDKEIAYIDEEIAKIQNTTKLQPCSTGNVTVDESRCQEIRGYYKDVSDAKRNVAYVLSAQKGDHWTMKALAESPIPNMVSAEALEKGKSARLRREKPAESYNKEQYQNLRKHYELVKTRVNDTLRTLGFVAGTDDDPVVLRARTKQMAELKHQESTRRTERKWGKYGRTA